VGGFQQPVVMSTFVTSKKLVTGKELVTGKKLMVGTIAMAVAVGAGGMRPFGCWCCYLCRMPASVSYRNTARVDQTIAAAQVNRPWWFEPSLGEACCQCVCITLMHRCLLML
jgi:hypothetical protein